MGDSPSVDATKMHVFWDRRHRSLYFHLLLHVKH
jgi:hypothetical protein